MKKNDIIQSFIEAFGVPKGHIVLHDFPKWSFYPGDYEVYHKKGIKEIHSFEFNAVERRVMYNYFKNLP